ncbi:MAG: protein glxC, partial [Arenicellales bacterium WSBS_2016_MAG_OTU3]
GGDIIVEGKIGYLSGFMAHAGRIIAIGGADDACADSLWGGEVWVAGRVKSLGVDSKVVEPTAEEVMEIEKLLASKNLGDSSREWQKIVSAEKLWHFESRDASAWLMI